MQDAAQCQILAVDGFTGKWYMDPDTEMLAMLKKKQAEAAAKFVSTVTIVAPTGKADAKRIMAVMCLTAKQGDVLTVTCEGVDEAHTTEVLQVFIAENLRVNILGELTAVGAVQVDNRSF